MKIILKQYVPNLGEEGDVCDVAAGYGRNYLIPKDLALSYTKQNIAIIESKRDAIEKRKDEKRKSAQGLKERLESETIEITMPAGETGKLFGSVTSATVMEALEKNGIEIERKRIEIPGATIKNVGNHEIRIKLYENETATVTLSVISQNKPKVKAEPVKSPAPEEKVKQTEEPAAEAQKETEEKSEAEDETTEAEESEPEKTEES